MAKTGSFIHTSAHTGLSLAVSNTFVAANRHAIDLNDELLVLGSAQTNRFRGRLSSIWIHVSTIAAGATGLTFSLSNDATGDNKFIGDTTATFSTGITTATQGNVTAKLDVDYVSTASDILYLHAKTDVGTCTITRIDLVWEE
jgi:hypothetical protein